MSDVDKALSSTSQGSAVTITIYSIVTIVSGIALNKSLKELWNMIDTIQYFHNLKYINYPWPSIIYDSIGYYSVVTL